MTDKIRHRLMTLAIAAAVFFALLLYREPAYGADLKLVDLTEASIEYRSYFPGGVDPIVTQNRAIGPRDLDKYLGAQINYDVLKYAYMENLVHSKTDKEVSGGGQFRIIGWQFEFGLDWQRLFAWLPLRTAYYHHSQHTADSTNSYDHFPVEDAFALKIMIFRK